jgi:hypothetical protein
MAGLDGHPRLVAQVRQPDARPRGGSHVA